MSDIAHARLRAQINDLPKYLLWRLAEAFQEFRPGYDADERYVKLSDLLKALDATEQEDAAPLDERIPSAWTEFGNGHDYSRTGKHDPGQCRWCLRGELQRLLADWREQDEALQAIFGACGVDATIACPNDVARIAVGLLEQSGSASPGASAPPLRYCCCEPAPDRSGRTCDKPKGHEGDHCTYGGNEKTWPQGASPQPETPQRNGDADSDYSIRILNAMPMPPCPRCHDAANVRVEGGGVFLAWYRCMRCLQGFNRPAAEDARLRAVLAANPFLAGSAETPEPTPP
jgi:hypothetical protein